MRADLSTRLDAIAGHVGAQERKQRGLPLYPVRHKDGIFRSMADKDFPTLDATLEDSRRWAREEAGPRDVMPLYWHDFTVEQCSVPDLDSFAGQL